MKFKFSAIFASALAAFLITVNVHAAIKGEWKFDGNGDNAQGGNAATIVNGASFFTSGGISGGYGYVPTGADYFQIAHNAIFSLPDAFTVEFWFRQRSDQGFLQDLVFKGSSPNNYNYRIYRQLWDGSNDGPVIAGYSSAGPAWNQLSNQNDLAHNVWHHVAHVKSATGQAYYLDGKLVHSSNATAPALTSTDNIKIGTSAVDTDFDELRISDNAKTAAEIEDYYRSLTPPVFIQDYPAADDIDKTNFSLKLKIDENGTAYYVVLDDGVTAPTAAEVKAGTGSGGSAPVNGGNAVLTANTEKAINVSVLMEDTPYDVYVVAEDDEPTPNIQTSPVKLDVKTGKASVATIPAGSTSQKYKIVSVNLKPPDPSPTAVLGPQIGTYDPTRFRIGRYNPPTLSYDEYPNMPNMHPGYAMWFLAKDGLNLTFRGIEADHVSNPDGADSVVVLIKEGWNQVGNPFDYPISVSEIMVYDDPTTNSEYLTTPVFNITQGIFWLYNNGAYNAGTTIAVHEGGWVKKLTTGDGKIYFRSNVIADIRVVEEDPYEWVKDAFEQPPQPPGGIESGGESGGGGGGGGGGCFLETVSSF